MANATRMTRTQWTFLLMLLISVCINYVDRGSLGVAGKMLESELHIDHVMFGKLGSAFFWTYAAFQIVAGWLVDRYNVNWVYGLGYLLWSVAMLLTGYVEGIAVLFGLRLLLGIGESVAYPAYSRIIARGIQPEHRGVANALVDAGSKMGPALGVLLGGLFMGHFGWRFFFVVTGAASLLWLIPWMILAPREAVSTEAEQRPPGMARICRERSAWGTFIGLICGNYAWYFLVFWLPNYFREARHYTQQEMSIFGSIPFWGVAAASLFGGWASDRWIARGGSITKVRKFFVATGLGLATLMLPAAMIPNAKLSLTLLTIACLSFGLYTSNVWAITQTLAGPSASGKWTGLQNAFGNISGVFGPWFTGWLVQETQSYIAAFVVTALFLAGGVFCFLFMVGPVRPVDWEPNNATLATKRLATTD